MGESVVGTRVTMRDPATVYEGPMIVMLRLCETEAVTMYVTLWDSTPITRGACDCENGISMKLREACASV